MRKTRTTPQESTLTIRSMKSKKTISFVHLRLMMARSTTCLPQMSSSRPTISNMASSRPITKINNSNNSKSNITTRKAKYSNIIMLKVKKANSNININMMIKVRNNRYIKNNISKSTKKVITKSKPKRLRLLVTSLSTLTISKMPQKMSKMLKKKILHKKIKRTTKIRSVRSKK